MCMRRSTIPMVGSRFHDDLDFTLGKIGIQLSFERLAHGAEALFIPIVQRGPALELNRERLSHNQIVMGMPSPL